MACARAQADADERADISVNTPIDASPAPPPGMPSSERWALPAPDRSDREVAGRPGQNTTSESCGETTIGAGGYAKQWEASDSPLDDATARRTAHCCAEWPACQPPRLRPSQSRSTLAIRA